MAIDKAKAVITDTGTYLFRRYSVNTKILDGYSGVFSRAHKTTIMYNKEYLKEANLEENYYSQDSLLDRPKDAFDGFIEGLTGYSVFTDESEVDNTKGYIELDATTDYVRSSSASSNQRTVEDLKVYTEGMVSEPDTISISATIDNYNSNKQEVLYDLHKKKIPVQVYSAKVNPDGIITDVVYDDTEEKLFIILDYSVSDVSSMNTVNISMSLSEVITFDAIEEVTTVVAKDTYTEVESSKDTGELPAGSPDSLEKSIEVTEPNESTNNLENGVKKQIANKGG